ncbi:MAG: prephenate dehydratase [Lachnospiraceae bacterium]|nr:prephenate dehydratase [Lachnospiraceae bacterium]
MELSEIREQLDVIDKEIVGLFEKRMTLAGEVAKSKMETGKNVYDKEREHAKLAAVRALASSDFNERGVTELFEQIMAISRKLQYKMIAEENGGKVPSFIGVDALNADAKVVFQGAEGSYSEAATYQFFGKDVKAFHVDTFRAAMLALDEGSAEYAVLPIENSTAGVVSEIYDLLSEFENFIVAEQVIPIEHCLVACPGTTMDSIQTVYSHPQSLMQSEVFLREHSSWSQVSMKNNAFAAKKVAEEKDITQAAIAGEHAANVYGLEILKKGVNHSDCNSTRFIIVSNRKIYLKDAKKISLCFEIPHECGSLYRIMSHFIYNDLNLTKIESRPMVGKNWEYRFFIDVEGNMADPGVRNALCGLREEAVRLRILGNY